MLQHGRISWDDMNDKDIFCNGLNREKLALLRHSCEILTHSETRERQRSWLREHDHFLIRRNIQALCIQLQIKH